MEDLGNREVGHLVRWGLNDLDARVLRCPESGVSGSEEEGAGETAGGGEVADAAVVTEEAGALAGLLLEEGDEGGEGNLVPGGEDETGSGQAWRGVEETPLLLGLAGDEDEAEGLAVWRAGGEGFEDLGPAVQRPGFGGGTAAGMEEEVGWQRGGVGVGVEAGGEVGEARGGIVKEEGQTFERASELGRGRALAGLDAVRALDEGFDAEAFEVAAEMAVGVEEVADDQVEGAKVGGDVVTDGSAGSEEGCHFPVAKTAHRIGETGGESEVGDAGIAEDLEVASGEVFAQEPDGRQGEDEVANRAATDDEDAGSGAHGSAPGRGSQ